MPHSQYNPEQMGHATLEPAGAFAAGSFQSFVLIYTAGYFGIDDTGTIKVTVKFDGKQRKGKVIRMSADPFCAKAHDEKVRSEKYLFGEGDTLRNVLVYISSDVTGAAESSR